MNYAVIPAYEPDEKIIDLVRELKQQGFEVVIVDDGSGDAYSRIFEEAGKNARVISYYYNMGKGHALKSAFFSLRNRVNQGDIIITMDCDGQHQVKDAVLLCSEAMLEPDTLFLGSRKQSSMSPLRSRLGNAITRNVFRVSTGVAVYDTQTGLRAFSSRLLPVMEAISGERYEYEMNMLLHCSQQGISIKEIPIQTIYIDGNAGSHFHVFRDSLMIYRDVLKFSASSLAGFILDYILYSLLAFCGVAPLSANIAARCVSSSVNFTINRKYVFRDNGSLWKSALRYFSLALLILICNSMLLMLFTGVLGINPWLAKLMAEIILFLCSYLVQKNLVFTERSQHRRYQYT